MEVGALVGASGPLVVLAATVGFFLKAYLEKRKGDQEDRRVDRESESGIVETTSKTLWIVRDQMVLMSDEARVLRLQVAALESQLQAKNAEIQNVQLKVTALESQLRAKDQVTWLQPERCAGMPSQRSSPPAATKDSPPSGLSR
jgi:hypothetical protein